MNPLHAFSQLSIKHVDHPFLIWNLILGGAAMCLMAFIFPSVGVIGSLIVLLLYVIATSLNTYRLVQLRLIDHQRQMQSLFSLYQTLNFKAPLPSLTGWAASPELLTQIMIQIKRRNPGLVVELGSGASTIAIPYMLEKWGNGKIVSIDHDGDFGELTRQSIELHEHKNVDVIVTPLVKHVVKDDSYTWYDVSNVTYPSKIDILLVDGPPEQTNPLARYPALPLLWDHLADDALILMDDADRTHERKIIRRWTTEYPVSVVQMASSLKGFAVLQVRKTKTSA
jgi:predicted O-methyltransferase YrrM